MMEEDVWLVPLLDGSPRIEKPPLLNWLTRWNFDRFGISLLSARSIVLIFAALFFPWTVLLVGLIWRYFRGGITGDRGQIQMLLLWTLLSLMPFLFIRSFDRYLVGTLVPASLLCASGIDALKSLRSGRRIAVLLSVLFVGLVIACCYWFKIAGYGVILLSLLIIGFAWIWCRAQQFWRLAAISALLWCAVIGLCFQP
jgi:4-amino-4-deoxy-L-arabinose transferase-like glycosyltransferase